MQFWKYLAAIAVLFAGAAHAQITTPAEYAVIMDYRTGEILYEKNARTPTAPASMSKLMTVAILFERLKEGSLTLEDKFDVSEKAWREREGSSMWVRVGDEIPVIDLLRGIIVQSGNDACIVVAEALGGTEENFAQMMTERAHELGLESANFANATGWPDPEHRISALDLARLARHIIESYPQYYDIYSETEFTYNGIRQYNRNPLLGVFDGADGLKTGHTEESGYGLVASAERDGVRRIVVFNGMDSNRDRADEAERLMRAAFTEFSTVDLVEADEVLGQAEVYLGVTPSVELRAAEALSFGLHRRDRDGITAELVYQTPLNAPVQEGDVVGQLEVSLPDGRQMSVPLEAAQSVSRKGAMGRAGAALARLIRGG